MGKFVCGDYCHFNDVSNIHDYCADLHIDLKTAVLKVLIEMVDSFKAYIDIEK
jgi:hypothetical protein